MRYRADAAGNMSRVLLGLLVGLVVAGPAFGGDWAQWLGPERDGTSDEAVELWQGEPKEVWRIETGIGYSAMVIRDGKAYTMGNIDDEDIVYCLDVETGKEIWTARYPCPANSGGYYGPRCTPAVDDKAVYTVSQEGVAKAYRVSDGKELWSKDLRRMGVKSPKWGISTSALLREDTILIDVGPILALSKKDGSVVMKSEMFPAGYSSPIVFEKDGKSLVASFNAAGLVVVEEETGKMVDLVAWKTRHDINSVTPVIYDSSRLLVSSSYQVGTAMFELSGGKLRKLWHSKDLGSQFNQLMPDGDYLFGFDDNVRGRRGSLKCISLDGGSEQWMAQDRRKLGVGSLLLARDKLIILGEYGYLIIAESDPKEYKPLAEAKILDGDYCWTPPVLANGKLYCRDYDRRAGRSAWVCLDLSPDGSAEAAK